MYHVDIQPDVVDELLRRLQELLAKQRGKVLLDVVVLLDGVWAEGDVRKFAMDSPLVVVRQQWRALSKHK